MYFNFYKYNLADLVFNFSKLNMPKINNTKSQTMKHV